MKTGYLGLAVNVLKMEKWEERNFVGNSELHIFQITLLKTAFSGTWRSGYCYLNKGGYNLNQSKDSFVEQVAKNNN